MDFELREVGHKESLEVVCLIGAFTCPYTETDFLTESYPDMLTKSTIAEAATLLRLWC